MGVLSDIGGTMLDVSRGMEYEKENQRRDATFARSEKRADMADKVSQYGLEDVQQARGDKAARRSAATGATSVDEAAKAEQAAALARGDTAGAVGAKSERLKALVADFQTTEAQFAQEQQPVKQGMERVATAGQAARQPGMEAVAGQQAQDQSMAMREKLLARFYQIAKVDVDAAKELLSNSPLIFPGKKVSDIMMSKDGTRMAIVGEDGQPLTMLNKSFMDQLAEKYAEPGKYHAIKPGETLVKETPGKVTPMFTAPNKDVPGHFSMNPDGAVLNTRTGEVRPGAGSASGLNPKRDARLKVADSIVKEALGGSLNMGLPGADAQKDYPIIMKKAGELIDVGVPPEKAAHDAIDAIKRQAKLEGMGGSKDAAATPAPNWRDFN